MVFIRMPQTTCMECCECRTEINQDKEEYFDDVHGKWYCSSCAEDVELTPCQGCYKRFKKEDMKQPVESMYACKECADTHFKSYANRLQ